MTHVLNPSVLCHHQAVRQSVAHVNSIEVRHAAQRQPFQNWRGEGRGGGHVHAEAKLGDLACREGDVRRERKPRPPGDLGPVRMQQIHGEVGPGWKSNMAVEQPPQRTAWCAERRRSPRAFLQEQVDLDARIVDVPAVFFHPRVGEEHVTEANVLSGKVADVDGFRIKTLRT